jgi:hypothetical protein
MTAVVEPTYRSPDSDLAAQVARLWPHRECEANIILGQFCRIGLHRWRRLDLSELVPGKDIRFCFSGNFSPLRPLPAQYRSSLTEGQGTLPITRRCRNCGSVRRR